MSYLYKEKSSRIAIVFTKVSVNYNKFMFSLILKIIYDLDYKENLRVKIRSFNLVILLTYNIDIVNTFIFFYNMSSCNYNIKQTRNDLALNNC